MVSKEVEEEFNKLFMVNRKQSMDKDEKMLDNMEKYGGSFIQALAECCRRADSINYRKLSNVFADDFEKYRGAYWKKRHEQN